MPKANTIGLLVNPNNPSTASSSANVQSATKELGKILVVVGAAIESQIDAAFEQFAEHKVDALLVEADPYLLQGEVNWRRERLELRCR